MQYSVAVTTRFKFLLLLAFALTCQSLYPIDPKQVTHCVGRFCSVDSESPLLRAATRPELTKEELFFGCSPGIPLREKTIPEGFVYADRNKKSVILPIVDHLEKYIEPGDILVQGESELALEKRRQLLAERGTLDLYGIANLNYVHTKLVYLNNEKQLRVLEVPLQLDPKTGVNGNIPEETDRPFHILRLRRDMDPEKRTAAIKKIDRFARFFASGVPQKKAEQTIQWPIFSYNKNFEKLAVCDPDKRSTILEAFKQFEAGEPDYYKPFIKTDSRGRDSSTLEFLCSGMPAAVYSLSDLPLPEMNTLPDVLNRLEDLVRGSDGKLPAPMPVLLEKYIDDHFKDTPRWPPDLATEEEKEAYERSGNKEMPASVRAYKKDLLAKLNRLMAMPPPQRGELFKQVHDAVITPADYFQDIFSERGFLTYAGTYVGKPCADKVLGRD